MMKIKAIALIMGTMLLLGPDLNAQEEVNCFLDDFETKTAVIPEAVQMDIPEGHPTVIVSLTGDTIGKVSKYVFGNAIAAWAGAHNDPALVEGVELLAPSLIRFPGGSWSNGYFWNGIPSDVPDSIYDGTSYNAETQTANKSQFWGQTGAGGWQTSPEQYYALRTNSNVNEGLITVNYGYARYGTSADPVGKAAHLAAEWVRSDNGRTKYWEIGNENGGPWEYGWMIDTALNQDGQPTIITGELYGKHFKVFADSMRNAAAETGATIYIGGQIVINGETSWNFVDRTWNEGFFREVGDYADFYVVHNYFDNTSITSILNRAQSALKENMDFIKQDFIDKGASPKPIALTEYNMSPGNDEAAVSYINGMQAVILIGELIKNNFGLAARWLVISGETTMFFGGSDENYLNHPHADFYYLAYLQKIIGDHAITTSVSNSQIACYTTRYASGETALILVNKGSEEQVITVDTKAVGVGNKFYSYSFTGGNDDDFSKAVFINGAGPDTYHWGPYSNLFSIKANAYPIEDEIKFISPGRSVQMILIESGSTQISVDESILGLAGASTSEGFRLDQAYPNPAQTTTTINYHLKESSFVSLKLFNIQGMETQSIIHGYKNAGPHCVELDTSNLQSGVYWYLMDTGCYRNCKKLIVL
ncbi:MAG: T9SS type A sorting domain-containing protein [Bacteroidales bacterium]|nr:T9SS type A sorting domain-containing protein [Bacteroidales bacterium]